ncbi:MAG: hypothetical protein Q4F72_00305 [Desulfovibrionaceae bacterium]|nr:hypothetical protein [Desulfovibrionaceae bacterium]
MQCLLLCQKTDAPAPEGGRRIYFDAWNVQEGDISLPRRMAQELLTIRAEHAAWAYDMGRLPCAGSTLAEALRGGSELSMWWTSTLYERHPKVSPLLYNVYRLRCLERLLLELGADSLTTRGLDPRCEGAVRAMCRGRGWKVECLERGSVRKTGLVRALYDRCPAFLRAVARFGAWLVQVRRKLPPAELAPSDSKTGTVVTYFPNIDAKAAEEGRLHSRYWESLHAALEEGRDGGAPAVRWLFVRFPSPQGSLEQCAAWQESFRKSGCSGISFNYIEEFLRAGDLARAVRRWLALTVASLRAEPAARAAFHFRDSFLDLWPLLGHEYAESFRGWRCLERCLQQQGLENYVRLAGPQKWYIFPMENCPWERMVTHAVHRGGMGPVYGTQHSTIRPTDFRYFDDPRTWSDPQTRVFQPDLVAGNGESAVAQWRDAGVPEERLGKIEALRYLYLAGAEKRTCAGPDRILVVTSFFADETDAHLELLAQCLKAGVLKPEQVTVKPHPYLPVREKLQALLGPMASSLRISTAPMPEELDRSPVVWASNSTTAILEAALMNLPVMAMQPAGDFDLCPIQDIPGLIRTADVRDVSRALGSLAPLSIDEGYLCLDTALPRWRALLGLEPVK